MILEEFQRVIYTLDLAGQPVCIHTSLRSFGQVAGGAQMIVQAFLNMGCTMLTPAFSWKFAVPAPLQQRPNRNGWHYERFAGPTAGIDRVFTPNTREIDGDMGAISAAVAAHPDRVRGHHPLCSFCALGPLAQTLINTQRIGAVFGPLRTLAQQGGFVILMGVDLTKMTLLHLAEQQAGRTPFRRWANDQDRQPMMVDVGGCSDGFLQFQETLASYRRDLTVGCSRWQIYPAAEVLAVATRAIQANPQMTQCENPTCERCRDAIAGGPILDEC